MSAEMTGRVFCATFIMNIGTDGAMALLEVFDNTDVHYVIAERGCRGPVSLEEAQQALEDARKGYRDALEAYK